MLLDLPVETVQVIMQTAERQGVSVAELLDKLLYKEQELFLNSDLTQFVPNQEQAEVIQALLDNPLPYNQELQNLLALTKDT